MRNGSGNQGQCAHYWYDFYVNNPWNPDVRGVTNVEIVQLFPGRRAELQSNPLLALPLLVCLRQNALGWFVIFKQEYNLVCTHYLGVIVPKEMPEKPTVRLAMLALAVVDWQPPCSLRCA